MEKYVYMTFVYVYRTSEVGFWVDMCARELSCWPREMWIRTQCDRIEIENVKTDYDKSTTKVYQVGPEPEINNSDACSPDVRFRSIGIIFLYCEGHAPWRYRGSVVKKETLRSTRIRYRLFRHKSAFSYKEIGIMISATRIETSQRIVV